MTGKKLSGCTAVVTGASQGLGKAIALALSGAGARIALVSRNRETLRGVAVEISAAGGVADIFMADVTDEDQVGALQKNIIAQYGSVHILINNAGINIRKPLVEFTLAEWNSVMTTNVTSAFLMCRALVPQMKNKGYGRIINMTSIMSHISLPERTAYSASKAALLGLTRALALELAGDGITVNGISPGPIATEMIEPLLQDPEVANKFLSRIPMGRWGRPEEIAQLALYLCSEDAGFITGTDVLIDGGWCAR